MKKSLMFLLLLLLAVGSSKLLAQSDLNIYGYFSTRIEKVTEVPKYEEGEIEYESEDFEWQYPYFNLMMQYDINNNLTTFVNINGGDGLDLKSIEVRNIWAEYKFSNQFKVRVGKSYKKFGLYNEILDAVPTYYGIEPPQYLNNDQPVAFLYPRTTALMISGNLGLGSGSLNYGVSIDKGLSEAYQEAFPAALDANYAFANSLGFTKLGVSYYNTFGTVGKDEEEEEEGEEFEEEGFALGSGTLPWMQLDEFSVAGGYIEQNIGDFIVQAGYWTSDHSSERNIETLEEMLEEVQNIEHVNRFLEDPEEGIEDENIIEDIDYTIETWYVRLGYSFYTSLGEFGPYLQYESYSNPELVALSRLNEEMSGMPDNGEFNALTLGVCYRPTTNAAIKFDISNYHYDFFTESQSIYEFKLDFSFIFGQ